MLRIVDNVTLTVNERINLSEEDVEQTVKEEMAFKLTKHIMSRLELTKDVNEDGRVTWSTSGNWVTAKQIRAIEQAVERMTYKSAPPDECGMINISAKKYEEMMDSIKRLKKVCEGL